MDIKFLGSLTTSDTYNTRNDITFSDTNDIALAVGRDYAKQKIVKAVTSHSGDDFYFPSYGSQLDDYLFQDIESSTIQNDIVNTILSALMYVETQEPSSDIRELISSIDNIELVPDVQNQTVYIRMNIILQDDTILELAVGGS